MTKAEIMSIYIEKTQTSIGYTVETQMGFITVATPNKDMQEYMEESDYAICTSGSDSSMSILKYGNGNEIKDFIPSVMYHKSFMGWHIEAKINEMHIKISIG